MPQTPHKTSFFNTAQIVTALYQSTLTLRYLLIRVTQHAGTRPWLRKDSVAPIYRYAP